MDYRLLIEKDIDSAYEYGLIHSKDEILEMIKSREAVFTLSKNPSYLESSLSFLEEDLDLESACKGLIPWRKGPFQFGDIRIDSEWRSDMKWNRITDQLPDLTGKKVLDLGCGNGYYMFRLLEQSSAVVLGLDPTILFFCQYHLCRKVLGARSLFFPLGWESLPGLQSCFDLILCMGVLYHHKDPVSLLTAMKEKLALNGQILLETLVLDDTSDRLLVPEKRYAKMRNVYGVPSIGRLKQWVFQAGFRFCDVVSVDQTTMEEQRSTEWSSSQSLINFWIQTMIH